MQSHINFIYYYYYYIKEIRFIDCNLRWYISAAVCKYVWNRGLVLNMCSARYTNRVLYILVGM